MHLRLVRRSQKYSYQRKNFTLIPGPDIHGLRPQ